MSFSAQVQNYNSPRSLGDRNLVQEVRQLLIENGLQNEVSQGYDYNHYILDAVEKIPEVQRYLLNRFWNLQLMAVRDVNSFEERFCLIPDGQLDDWLRLFREKILPFAIQHRLPRPI